MLALDRTEWMIGKTPVNFLVLALTIKKFSFPLTFSLLDKEGSSSTAEVTTLVKTVLTWFLNRRVLLLADREFLSQDLLKFLTKIGWDFNCRLKKNARVSYKGNTAQPEQWFTNLLKGQGTWLKRKVYIYGVPVYLVGIRLHKPTEDGDEFVFVVTNRCPSVALGLYSYRWGIENLFASLKSRGFNLEATMPEGAFYGQEATRIRCSVRLKNLLSLLTIAVFWAYQCGELISSYKPIRVLAMADLSRVCFGLAWML